jgi:hypothetical protein
MTVITAAYEPQMRRTYGSDCVFGLRSGSHLSL